MLSQSKQLLDGEEEVSGILQMFEELTNNLSQLTHFLPQMEPLAMRMEEIGYDLSDCAGDLGNYLDQMDYQPQELEQVEERLDLIYRLKRKYGNSVEEILEYLEKSREQLQQLNLSEEKAQELQEEYLRLKPQVQQAADLLTSRRHKAAKEFLSRVKKELEFKCQRRAQRLEAGWTGRAGIFNQLQCRRRAEAAGKNCIGRRAFPRDALD